MEQIAASRDAGASAVEIHTGRYADADDDERGIEFEKIIQAVRLAHDAGLRVNAGHGLNYRNVQTIAGIPELYELNIGHAIVARAVLCGMMQAVAEMKLLMNQARM